MAVDEITGEPISDEELIGRMQAHVASGKKLIAATNSKLLIGSVFEQFGLPWRVVAESTPGEAVENSMRPDPQILPTAFYYAVEVAD